MLTISLSCPSQVWQLLHSPAATSFLFPRSLAQDSQKSHLCLPAGFLLAASNFIYQPKPTGRGVVAESLSVLYVAGWIPRLMKGKRILSHRGNKRGLLLSLLIKRTCTAAHGRPGNWTSLADSATHLRQRRANASSPPFPIVREELTPRSYWEVFWILSKLISQTSSHSPRKWRQ